MTKVAAPKAPEEAQTIKTPDPIDMARQMADIAVRGQRVMQQYIEKQQENPQGMSMGDPLNVGHAFMDFTTKLWANPTKLMEAQVNLWQQYTSLWQHSTQKLLGETEVTPVIEPSKTDKRFKDPAWSESVVFDFIKQSYLLTSQWMQTLVKHTEGLDDKTAKKVDFYTRQIIDASSPTNFLATNPEALRLTMETGGQSLVTGLEHLVSDLERGGGSLKISMTDYNKFKVGDNLAITPGKVVFENDLIQLIQYTPTTEKVQEIPLLITPPWINKYYILDLQAKNSFVKWAVDQGITVFMISWVNPDADDAGKTFEDYMQMGIIAALDKVKSLCGVEKVNTIGYCLGGTLLASALAYLTAKKQVAQIASATFFTTMLDFTDAGELSVFIDDEQLEALEARMSKRGFLDGSEMATTFNMLRANDLIWSFVVNNYLLGKEPFPFDLLYWNADSTRMPAAMHSFYLRNMYQHNKLVQKGGVTLDGVAIDLTTIKTPSFFLSTAEDHIAPWKSTYVGAKLLKGDVTFCLAASGHIAGVINPPANQKYWYWLGHDDAKSADAWLDAAKKTDGSWWPAWVKWLGAYGGKQIPARKIAESGAKGKKMEDAPGRYVTVRS
ncbi:MAG: PHA/PHB synthase family protein [Holosporales bacterium]